MGLLKTIANGISNLLTDPDGSRRMSTASSVSKNDILNSKKVITQPKVYDKAESNVEANAKVNVRTLNETTYQTRVATGRVQPVRISDDDSEFTQDRVNRIGRARLLNIQANDKVLAYDTVTGELFRWDNDTEDEATIRQLRDATAQAIEYKKQISEAKLVDYARKMDLARSDSEKELWYNKQQQELTAYNKSMQSLVTTYSKYNEQYKATGKFVPNDDFKKSMDEYAAMADKAIVEENKEREIQKLLTNYDDPRQINSFADVFWAEARRLSAVLTMPLRELKHGDSAEWYQKLNNQGYFGFDANKENALSKWTMRGIKLLSSKLDGKITDADYTAEVTKSLLTNFAETVDIVQTPVTGGIRGAVRAITKGENNGNPIAGMFAGVESAIGSGGKGQLGTSNKTYDNWDGSRYNYSFDINEDIGDIGTAGNIASFVLDVLDVDHWLGKLDKVATKSINKTALNATVDRVAKESAITVTTKQSDKIVKRAIYSYINGASESMEDALTKSITQGLKVNANVGDVIKDFNNPALTNVKIKDIKKAFTANSKSKIAANAVKAVSEVDLKDAYTALSAIKDSVKAQEEINKKIMMLSTFGATSVAKNIIVPFTKSELVREPMRALGNKILNLTTSTVDNKAILAYESPNIYAQLAEDINTIAKADAYVSKAELDDSVIRVIYDNGAKQELQSYLDIMQGTHNWDAIVKELDEAVINNTGAEFSTFAEYKKALVDSWKPLANRCESVKHTLSYISNLYDRNTLAGIATTLSDTVKSIAKISSATGKIRQIVDMFSTISGVTDETISIGQAAYNAIIKETTVGRGLQNINYPKYLELKEASKILMENTKSFFDAVEDGNTAKALEVRNTVIGSCEALDQISKDYKNIAHKNRMLFANKANVNYKTSAVTQKIADETVRLDKAQLGSNIKELVRTISSDDYELSKEEMESIITDSISDSLQGRIYGVQLDKVTNMLGYACDKKVAESVDSIIDATTTTNKILNYAVGSESAKQLLTATTEYSVQNHFVNTIVKHSGAYDTILDGVIDTVASHSEDINRVLNRSYDNMDLAAEDVTDEILRHTTNYVNKKYVDFSLKSVTLPDGARTTFNSVDTNANVSNLISQLDNGVIKHTASKDSEDIVFSVSSNTKNGAPMMLTISTRDGSNSITLINKDIPMTLTPGTAYKYYGTQDVSAVAKQFDEASKKFEVVDTDTFDSKVSEFLKDLQHNAQKNKKTMRYVGFNNSYNGTNQDYILAQLFKKHAYGAYIGDSVDLADSIRSDMGYIAVTDEARIALQDAVSESLFNARNVYGANGDPSKLTLTSTFDTESIQAAEMMIKKLDDFDGTVTDDVDALLNVTDKAELDIMRSNLVSFIENANRVSDKLIDSNAPFQNMFINEKLLVDTINAHRYGNALENLNMQKALFGEALQTGRVNLNTIQLWNRKYVEDWFDVDGVLSMFKEINFSTTADSVFRLTKRLNETFSSIVNFDIVNQFSVRDFDNFVDTLMTVVQTKNVFHHSSVLQYLVACSKSDLDVAHRFVVTTEIMKELTRISGDDTRPLIAAVINAIGEDDLLMKSIMLSDNLVYNKDLLRYGFDATLNKAKTTADYLNMCDETHVEFSELNNLFNTVDLKLTLHESTRSDVGVFAGKQDIYMNNMQELAKTMNEFQSVYDNAMQFVSDKYSDTIKGSLDKVGATASMQAYATELNRYKNVYTQLSQAKTVRTTAQVWTLSPEYLEAFIVRNCNNVYTINANSKLVSESGVLINALPKLVKNARIAGLTVDIDDKNLIRIYKDLRSVQDVDSYLVNMDTLSNDIVFKHHTGYVNTLENRLGLTDKLKLEDPKFAEFVTEVGESYQKFERVLADKLPQRYFFSNGVMTTQEAYDSIVKSYDGFTVAAIPATVRSKLGWLNDSFACNVIDDSDGIRDFYKYYSPNIVNNMRTGINMVSNNSDAVTNMLHFAVNPNNSFARLVDGSMSSDWQQIKAAIDSHSEVLFRVEKVSKKESDYGYALRRLYLNTERDFNNFINDSRVMHCSDANYLELYKYISKTNKDAQTAYIKNTAEMSAGVSSISAKIANNFMNSTALKVLRGVQGMHKVGWLFTHPGTWVRNAFDATTKGFLETKDVTFAKYLYSALNDNSKFDDLVNTVTKEYNITNPDTLRAYFLSKYEPTIAEQQYQKFMTMLEIKSHASAGMESMFEKMRNVQFDKLAEQAKTYNPDVAVTRDMFESNAKLFDVMMAKFNVNGKLDWMSAQNFVRETLTKSGKYTPEQVDSITAVCLNYTPEFKSKLAWLSNSYPAKLYIDFNQNMFKGVEDTVRLALARWYMDNVSDSISEAMGFVIKSQFDYTTRGKTLDAIEAVMPFSTFKYNNLLFWADKVTSDVFTAQAVSELYQATGIMTEGTDEVRSTARSIMYHAQLQSGEIQQDTDDADTRIGLAEMYLDEAREYKGTSEPYVVQNGGVPVGNGLYLKLGNTFLDAATIVSSIVSGNGLSFMESSIYSPFVTVGKIIEQLSENGTKDLDQFVLDNNYDLLDLIPVYGALANSMLTALRSSVSAMAGNLAVPHLLRDLVGTTAAAVLTNNSIIGTLNTNLDYYKRPIGTDWYSQDEEYKKTHRFVYGVSYVPTWIKKDPTKYIDHIGMLSRLGFTKDEATQLLGMKYDSEKGLIQDENMPDMFKYDQDTFDRTMAYLVDRGYGLEEAYNLCGAGTWVDADGKEHHDADLESLYRNSVFLELYNKQPEYIKYEDGQYSKLKEYYKEQGIPTDAIPFMMQTQNGYVHSDGSFEVLSTEQRVELEAKLESEYYEKMHQKHYEKSKKSGKKFKKKYSKAHYTSALIKNYQDGSNAFKTVTSGTRSRTSAGMPGIFRHMQGAANRTRFYSDLYAKHGASRMAMRANIQGYSNASITKLHRGELKANRTMRRRLY